VDRLREHGEFVAEDGLLEGERLRWRDDLGRGLGRLPRYLRREKSADPSATGRYGNVHSSVGRPIVHHTYGLTRSRYTYRTRVGATIQI